MSFVITYLIQDSISHLETGHTVPAGQAPRGVYFEIEHYDDICWYIKNHYDNPDLIHGSSTINLTDKFGEFSGKKTLDHLIFRIKRSAVSNRFLALSFNLRLHSYSPDSEYIPILNISENVQTRYHIQCIDISDNGEFFFYSNWNSIVRLDQNLRILETWRIPDKFSRHNKATSSARQQAISILGLSIDPSIDEIKTAFRKNLLKVHPDINRNDPQSSEKTRAVVESYEVLTRGALGQGDNESDNGFLQVHLSFEGDSITATQIRIGTEDLYVGCYSGKIYILLRNGKSKLIYDIHAPVRKIRESGKYLYLVSDQFWDILLNGIVVNRIEGSFRFDRILFEKESNSVMSNHKSVRLYSLGGIAFAEIDIKENISDVFLHDQKLRVLTGKKSYIFSIQPPSDYGILAQKDHYLPY